MGLNSVLEKLYRIKEGNNFAIYTLLSQYDTEVLLFMMAKANNEKIKKIISNYFTKLKNVKLKLKGKDLKEMGITPGPIYREIFSNLLEARLNNWINTKEDEIHLVKENYLEKY